MENTLQVFNNPKFGKIRTITIDGVPYFVGKDVATALGYSNASKAVIVHVEDEDKITLTQKDFEKTASNQDIPKMGTSYSDNDLFGNNAMGGVQRVTFINESGLYSLILSSKLPQAKEFKHWVTSAVLPAINHYGVYATKDAAEYFLKNPEQAAKVFMELANERKENARLLEKNAILTQKVEELTPKANYCDIVLQSKGLVPVTLIAKDYGYSAKTFNKILKDLGVQYKVGGTWVLTEKFNKLGWTKTKTHHFTHSDGKPGSTTLTYWTQKGRLELYYFLKKYFYLPRIELDFSADDIWF